MTSQARTLARLLTALDEIEKQAEANIERGLTIQNKVRWIREQLDTGMPVTDVVEAETSPRVVALITTNKEALEEIGRAHV